MTILALRSDTREPVWGVTVLRPPTRSLVPLYIPPVITWAGVPVLIRTENPHTVTETGPYNNAWQQ